MTRALVIYGDSKIGTAIADGLTAKELAMVKAENKRLKAKQGVKEFAEDQAWKETKEKLARTYHVKQHGKVYGFLLLAWALLWVGIFAEYARLSAINREA